MNAMNMNGINGVNGANGTMNMMNQAMVNGTGSIAGPASGHKTGLLSDVDPDTIQTKLNTSIYDYFLKHEQYECARAVFKSSLNISTMTKGSPGKGQDVNGMDDHSGDDSKDKADKTPDDLPAAMGTGIQHDTSFLLDWYSLFWDMFLAQRGNKGASPNAVTYAQQQNARLREQQRLGYMQPGAMQGGGNYQNIMRMPNGMPMKADLQRQMAANRNITPQQMQQAMKQQQALQMQREGSDIGLNVQRPRTPSADNAPSPSKRPRIDGGPTFNGQMMQNGRPGQAMPNQRMLAGPNQTRNLLAGMQTTLMSPAQVEAFSNQPEHAQQKSIQMFQANQGNGMGQQHMAGQGSPMMPGSMDPANQIEMYGAARGGNVPMGGNGQNGNHALQDYQMQLMLLEQQNKKRLMMARQEQDNQTMRPDGQPMPGQPGIYQQQGMSPQGSRAGPSPNPTDQMKRGTPKMGQVGLPGSPMPDVSMAQGRNSPGSMGFTMPNTDVFQNNNLGVGPNGSMMRPPSSHPNFPNGAHFAPQHQLEAMRQHQNGGRMQNPAGWSQVPPGQGPMMQPQPGQGQQPAQMGTPRQQNQNTMGPPTQAPPAPNAADAQRPRSPALTNPPTPSQKNNTITKGKKDGKEAPRKRPTKKNSVAVANTPAAEADNTAPTPTPSTPVNVQHNVNGKAANGPNPNAALQAPTSLAAPQNIPPPQTEPQFGDMNPEVGIEMGFGPIDGEDVLGGFDFDSFLQENGDPDMGFGVGDASIAFANFDGMTETEV